MEGSEVFLLFALLGLLLLAGIQRRQRSRNIEAGGSGLSAGPVRERPASSYGLPTSQSK